MSLTAIIPLMISLPLIYIIARNSLLAIAEQQMQNSTQYIYKMCEIQSDDIDKKFNRDLEQAVRILKNEMKQYRNFGFQRGTVKASVKNQASGEETALELPIFSAGGTILLKNYILVDSIIKKINIPGATSTIFQLYDEKLIRISTNVKTADGKRAVYTYIPSESLVYKTIIRGKAYRGRAIVLDNWNMTYYEPIQSVDGKVIGSIYVGIPAPKTAIFDMITSTKIGGKGYVYIINSQGQFIEHPTLKGKTVTAMIDPSTKKPYMDEVISKKNGPLRYRFPDTSGNVREIFAYAHYFEKWDWIITASMEYNDLFKGLKTVFIIMIVLLIGFPFILVVLSSFVAGRISQPFRTIIDTAVKVSNGDLTVFIPRPHYKKCVKVKNCEFRECPAHDSRNLACWRIDGTLCDNGRPVDGGKDKKMEFCCECEVYQNAIQSETEELIEAINNMIVTIRRMINDVKVVTERLMNQSVTLSGISSKMETESMNQASCIEETTSSNEQLMASIENVATSAGNQAEKVALTSAAMEELTASTKKVGEDSELVSREATATVQSARETERMLQDTTRSIDQIATSSKKIVDIVAIINDISDKINLLSLNAAIEAARAGDQGKGFAVVSEEISKLADATARSTKEIESLITTSRSDIEKGASLVTMTASSITEMINKIEKAAGLFKDIAMSSSEQIKGSEQVMLDVEDINQMSDQIAQATGEQKTTSTEILNALERVNKSIQEIANSAQGISEAAKAMEDKAKTLNSATSRFTV